MLNRWRLVEYTDDGCSIYECLKCDAQWEARTSPEHSHWRFCPVCGTQWQGALPLNRERANHRWQRRAGGSSDRQRELAALCEPMWQVFFQNTFTDGCWEKDGEPFRGSARLAVSHVNKWKRLGQDRHLSPNLYRIELVPTTQVFPLP